MVLQNDVISRLSPSITFRDEDGPLVCGQPHIAISDHVRDNFTFPYTFLEKKILVPYIEALISLLFCYKEGPQQLITTCNWYPSQDVYKPTANRTHLVAVMAKPRSGPVHEPW